MHRSRTSLALLVAFALVTAVMPLPALASSPTKGVGAAGVSAAFRPVPASVPDTVGAWVPDADVSAIAVAPDGTTYVGGDFQHFGPLTGGGALYSRVESAVVGQWPYVKSTNTTTVAESSGPSGVHTAVSDGAGGYYVGGAFDAIGNVEVHNLAHIRADGTVDPAWRFDTTVRAGFGDWIRALAIEGSTLYVVGQFDGVGGTSRRGAAAIDLPSKTVTGWDPSLYRTSDEAPADLYCVAVGTDGVFLGGNFLYVNGNHAWPEPSSVYHVGLAKVDKTDGNNIGTFSADTSGGIVTAMTMGGSDAAGYLFVSGRFTAINGTPREHVAKLNATTGEVDTAWNPAGMSSTGSAINAVAAHGNTVYIGGSFTQMAGVERSGLVAVSADGTGTITSWYSYAPNGVNPQHGAVECLTIAGGKLFAGGGFDGITYSYDCRVVAFDLELGGDRSQAPPQVDFFSIYSDGPVHAIGAPADGGPVYVGGPFASAGMSRRQFLASLTPGGELTSWDPRPSGSINALAYGNGRVYAGGVFTLAGDPAVGRLHAAAWDSAGTLAAWDPQPDGVVQALRYHNGQVLMGGNFANVDGAVHGYLAAVDPVTGDAAAWAPQLTSGGAGVRSIIASGTEVWVGGDFIQAWTGTAWTTTETKGLAKFLTTSSNVQSFDGIINGGTNAVNALALTGAGLVIGGDFSDAGGYTRPNIAAEDPSTAALSTTFNPGANGQVRALLVNGQDLYVGGDFGQITLDAGSPKAALLDATNGNRLQWAPVPDKAVRAFGISGSELYAGGSFDTLGTDEWVVPHLARFSGAVAANPAVLNRFAGQDRWQTMQFAAQNAFPTWAGVTDVVVACGDDRAMADPLSASGLAGAYGCPLLLVRNKLYTNSTPLGAAGNLLQQMGRVNIHVVGGPVAVSPAVYNELAKSKYRKGGTIERFNGANRYNTAELVATRIESIMAGKGTPVSGYLIANGAGTEGYYDALAWAPISYAQHFPLLLTRAGDAPGETVRHLGTFDRSKVWALGNTSNISATAMAMLWLPESQRITGADRYGKARAAAEFAIGNGWASWNDVAIGQSLPDALAGGACIGRKNGVMLYTLKSSLPTATYNALSGNKASIRNIFIMGGLAAVDDTAKGQIQTAVAP